MGAITRATLSVVSRVWQVKVVKRIYSAQWQWGSVPFKGSLDKCTRCVPGPGLDRGTQDKVLSLGERVGRRETAGG